MRVISIPETAHNDGADAIIMAEQPDLYVEGGDHANLVHISGRSFQQLMRDARHGLFTDTLAPA